MPVSSERVTTIDLLRHGACQGGEIFRGRTDVHLSTQGWEQMERAVSAAPDWQRVITSPLVRCRAFAERCAARCNVPLQVEAALQEMDFGAWEGRLAQEVWQENPQLLARFYDDPAAVSQFPNRDRAHLDESRKFGEHQLHPQQRTCRRRILPRDTN